MSDTTRDEPTRVVEAVSPGRQLVRAYRPELSVVAIVLVSLLLAAMVAGSDGGDEPVYLSEPARSDVDLRDDLYDPQAPLPRTHGTLAAMVPGQVPVSIVTVPVPMPVAIPGESASRATATTRTTLPRYDNGSQPPTVDITRVGPQNQDPGQPVELRFRAGDGDGVIAGWIISWGDGRSSADTFDERCGPPPGEPDHEFTPQRHTYREMGTYEIEILVVSKGTCGAGPTQRATDRASIQIGPPIPNLGL